MRYFAGPRLLVNDEVGYLPLASEAAVAVFQVINQRYLKGSICLTTNLQVGSWGKIFMVAAAMLDWLLHRSVVFNIDGTATGCASTGPDRSAYDRVQGARQREVPPRSMTIRQPTRRGLSW